MYLPAGARRYLGSTLKMPLEVAVRIDLEDQSLQAVKEAAYFLVQATLETNLNALKSGVGIL
jgi:hypothetical protein